MSEVFKSNQKRLDTIPCSPWLALDHLTVWQNLVDDGRLGQVHEGGAILHTYCMTPLLHIVKKGLAHQRRRPFELAHVGRR